MIDDQGAGDNLYVLVGLGLFDKAVDKGLDVGPGQRLVDISGDAAQGTRPFGQINLESLVGQLQGRGHTGDTAADHQDILVDGKAVVLERMGLRHGAYGHPHQILGLFRGLFRQLGVDPGGLITDIGNLHHIFIQPGLTDGLLKLGLMGPRRTAADDHPVQAVVNDALLDLFDGLTAAAMSLGLGHDHIGQCF